MTIPRPPESKERYRLTRLETGLYFWVSLAMGFGCGGATDTGLRMEGGLDGTTSDAQSWGSNPADASGSTTDLSSPDAGLADTGQVADAGRDEGSIDGGSPTGDREAGADGGPRIGGGDAGAGDGGIDDGGDAGVSGCSIYCSAVMTACRGVNAQYKDNVSCMNACQYISSPVGVPVTSDPIACRTMHAALAITAPNPHCWNAGPFGYGSCDSPQDAFCRIAAGREQAAPGGFCSPAGGFDGGILPYGSNAECTLRAYSYSRIDTPTNTTSPPGSVGLDGGFSANGPAAGDTFDCRAYHLVLALQGGAFQQRECANAAPNSPTCR